MTQSHPVVSGKENAPVAFADRVAGKMPLLFAIWLFLAVLGPHQEVYKVFFHGVVIPALLVMACAGRLTYLRSDPLIRAAFGLFAYAAITTFVIGLGPVENHFRALRWCVESAFLLLALWVWMPAVMARSLWWARYLLWLALLGAAAGIVRFVVFEDFVGRLNGLGGLHNPIHTGAVLLVLFAMGHFIMTRGGYPRGWQDRALVIFSFVLVCVAVLMSESRAPIGAMVVYFLVLAVLGLLARPNWKEVFIYSLALVLAVTAVTFLYGPERFIDQLMARGMSYRLEIWKGYFLYPPDSWWFGFGLGTEADFVPAVSEYWEPNDVPAMHPHSVYIGTLVETGIIGVLFLALMVGLVIYSVISHVRPLEEKLRLLGVLGLVFLLTFTASQGVISSAKAIWIYLWMPVGFVWFWAGASRSKSQIQGDTP